MAGIADDLNSIKGDVGDLRGNNQVARFAYTQDAYTNDEAAGRASFDINENNNIPTKDATALNTNATVLDRGFQTQASSITRQLQNHFYGRVSYNLNKIVDRVWQTLGTLSAAMGRSDSAAGDVTRIATLDTNGRLPSNQLTEDAMEIKAYWDASTNSPDLTSAANRKPGNVYYVSTEGTRDIGGGSKTYYVGDVLICNKSLQWERIPVTYVKGGAENASAYRTGKADITKANVGLGSVADIDQSPGLKDLTFTASASAVTVGGTKLDGNAASLTGASFPMASSTQAGLLSASDYDLLHNMVLNSTYPVGTVYWTSNSSFDPNVGFGGTWVRIKDTFVYAAGDSDTVTKNVYTAETTGQVTLSSSNLPPHAHSVSLSGSTADGGTHAHGAGSLYFSGNTIKIVVNGGTGSDITNATWSAGGSGSNGNDGFWQWGAFYFTPSGGIGGSTADGGTHAHSVSLSGSTADGPGSSTAFNVVPKKLNRYCWERTA